MLRSTLRLSQCPQQRTFPVPSPRGTGRQHSKRIHSLPKKNNTLCQGPCFDLKIDLRIQALTAKFLNFKRQHIRRKRSVFPPYPQGALWHTRISSHPCLSSPCLRISGRTPLLLSGADRAIFSCDSFPESPGGEQIFSRVNLPQPSNADLHMPNIWLYPSPNLAEGIWVSL